MSISSTALNAPGSVSEEGRHRRRSCRGAPMWSPESVQRNGSPHRVTPTIDSQVGSDVWAASRPSEGAHIGAPLQPQTPVIHGSVSEEGTHPRCERCRRAKRSPLLLGEERVRERWERWIPTHLSVVSPPGRRRDEPCRNRRNPSDRIRMSRKTGEFQKSGPTGRGWRSQEETRILGYA